MSRTVTTAAFLGLLALLAARGAAHALAPPFELELVKRTRPEASVTGLSLTTGRGRVVVRAREAHAGRLEVGPYEIGPPSSIVLRDVVVDTAATGSALVVKGARGEIRGHSIVASGNATVFTERGVRVSKSVRIDLDTGAVGD